MTLWSVPLISYFLSIAIQSIALIYSLGWLQVIVYKFSVLASISGQYSSQGTAVSGSTFWDLVPVYICVPPQPAFLGGEGLLTLCKKKGNSGQSPFYIFTSLDILFISTL